MHQILGVKGLGYGWVLCVFFNKASHRSYQIKYSNITMFFELLKLMCKAVMSRGWKSLNVPQHTSIRS